jgi:hypothetical protein
MKSFLSLSLLLAVPSLFLQRANGATFHRNSLSVSNTRSDLFGVSKLSKIPRGGAEDASGDEEEKTLYLPGLLDTELTKSSQVRISVE